MEYKISIFINDLFFLNNLIIEIYELLNKDNIEEIWIKKSIQKGHHIEIYSLDIIQLKKIEKFVISKLRYYSPIVISKKKLKKQIKSISEIENRKPDLDIQKDGSVIFEKIDRLKLNKIEKKLNSLDVEFKVEKKKMEIILYLEKQGFFHKSESQQNIILTKLFLNLGLLFNNDLRLGYLSMKSNILLFNKQLEELKSIIPRKKYKYYYDMVNFLNLDEKKFIDEDIETFLLENENSFFRYFVTDIYDFFSKELEKGNLYYKNLNDVESFIKRFNGVMTDFHKTFFSDENFVMYHTSKEFIIYRYTVDILYKIMPLLNVNLLRKQKITKMVSDKVEKGYNITWKDSYSIMENHF